MSEFNDDDALAAEYVIGTLDQGERDAVDARRRHDTVFSEVIAEWTSRLAPLLEIIPPVEPDARLHGAVLAEIDRLRAAPANDNVVKLRRQLRLWRSATGLSAAAAVLLALWGGSLRLSPPPATYVAVLQQGGSAPAFLVTVDLKNRLMTVTPSAATTEPDKSLQLWMIAGTDAPQSLGLVDTAAPIRKVMPEAPSDIISKATYAVTLEPKGGSPKPTSAPIYVGHLIPETG